MCKAPKPPKPKAPDKPEWLRNPYLDAATGQSSMVDQLRLGRSSLRIDLGSGLGIRPSSPAAQGTVGTPHVRGLGPPAIRSERTVNLNGTPTNRPRANFGRRFMEL